MKCQVCGSESGKYLLCRSCNLERENGNVIKCEVCGNWHSKNAPCKTKETINVDGYLYEPKKRLITKNESVYFDTIRSSVPQEYHVFPQINLASFVDRTDNSRYRNELFRNVDFLITDSEYMPKIVVEINDQSHLGRDRQMRDEKVRKICEEAGIPIIKLWTSYGVKPDYIRKRIEEGLASLPVERIHHFNTAENNAGIGDSYTSEDSTPQTEYKVTKKKGCYIATAVYGSYDCPEVWTLRRYRDLCLMRTIFGRQFVRIYYTVSPAIVEIFGKQKWFNILWKSLLDKFVCKLHYNGISDKPYYDDI